MWGVTCNSLEVPRLINPGSVSLKLCQLPDHFMEKLLRQLFGCGESLQRLGLVDMIFEPFQSLLEELLEDLVGHHERKREAGLAQRKLLLRLYEDWRYPTNLFEEFMKKWRNRCEKVDSINSRIN